MAQTTVDKIIDQAESCIRTRGYDGFSFRDIAKAVGIKSASIHYHFPTKGDLAAEVAKRYTTKFMGALEKAEKQGKSQAEQLLLLIALFRQAYQKDKKMCLCGMLAAASDGLPAQVLASTRYFFERCLSWLERTFNHLQQKKPSGQHLPNPHQVMATLEGALLLAWSMGSIRFFEEAVKQLESDFKALA